MKVPNEQLQSSLKPKAEFRREGALLSCSLGHITATDQDIFTEFGVLCRKCGIPGHVKLSKYAFLGKEGGAS